MLTADDVQKWLEEKRGESGGARQGPAPEPGRRRDAAASATPVDASPSGQGPNVLVLRNPVRAPGPDGVLAAMGSVDFEPAERPWGSARGSWPLTLAVGLLSGLVLGVGLVGLAGSARPWIAGLLGADPPAASADAEATTPATQPQPAEPAAREAVAPAPPQAAPRPVTAVLAGPSASDAAPSGPRLVDPPGRDPRAVFVQADRRLPRRAPAALEPAAPVDDPAPVTATARLAAAPWRPSPLPLPEVDPEAPVRLAASAAPAARVGPVQVLAAPSGPDRPVSPDVAATALAAAPPPPAAAPLRVALHLAPSLPQSDIYEAQAAVTEAGFDLAATSLARFGVAQSEVRFFHGDDAAGAARIADSLGARARDFSAFRPAPPPGTLEVWLAPEG